MLSKNPNQELFNRIRIISNRHRFKIIEMTQENLLSITELSSKLKLAYTKCADYVTILENSDLVKKIKNGRNTKVKSRVKLEKNKIQFLSL